MEYLRLEEVNKKLKKVPIQGKKYVEVNERIKAFWKLCEEGKIITELLKLEDGICVFKAYIYENKNDPEPRATGTAQEKEGSSFINKTSYVENCETSAIGRALGNAGIGIDTSVASANEVANAMENQKKISPAMVDALKDLIKTKNISNDIVIQTLEEYGYKKLADIQIADITYIRNKFARL